MIVTLETFEKALVYAIGKHSGTMRKGGSHRPYILHPFSVMQRIYANKVSENMYLLATAAILHDVVEDEFDNTDEGLKEIAELFGYHVAALVQELTLDKSKYTKDGVEYKKEYLAEELNNMSSYALAIKLCDRLDNVCDMKDMSEAFITKYVIETHYILNNLNRKLSATHKRLIVQIEEELSKHKLIA